jgi:TctA family transporter
VDCRIWWDSRRARERRQRKRPGRLWVQEPPNIGLVLGGDLEEQFRLSLTLNGGDPAVFLRQPIAAGFLALTLATLMGPVVRAVRARRGG